MGILVYADISRYFHLDRTQDIEIVGIFYFITAESCDSKQYILQHFKLPSS